MLLYIQNNITRLTRKEILTNAAKWMTLGDNMGGEIKPVRKTLYGSTHMSYFEQQNHRDRK
jgi:hypothetical protein